MEESDKRDNPKTDLSEAVKIQTESTRQSVDGVSKQPLSKPARVADKKWLTPSLIGLVIISLGMAGYFAYQNYQLKRYVSEMKPKTESSLVASPQPTPEEQVPVNNIENSTVVFGKEGKIFLLKGLSAQPIEIAEGDKPALSPDRSKIAYIKMDIDKNIYIYDIATAKTETIQTNEGRLREVSWSPDGKYLITDSGTCVVGSGAIFGYPIGNKIASFGTYGKIKWVSDNELVFEQPQDVSPSRPYGGGEGSGLAKIKLPNGEKRVLTQANELEDFSLLKTENGIIYFSKRAVENSNDWSYSEKKKISYWQMNSDGSGKKMISKPEILSEKVASNLPTEFSKYRVFSEPILHPSLNDWVIFEISEDNSSHNGLICIMNINNPVNSFKQIVVGSDPSW